MCTTYIRGITEGQGSNRGRYNQIANYAPTQTEINIAIGDKAPDVYFRQIAEQCEGGEKSLAVLRTLRN